MQSAEGNFRLDVTLPTGQYSDQQPVNLSNRYVVVEPYYAVTNWRYQAR